MHTTGISIIGSRTPTDYGKFYAEKIAMDLAVYGVTIISGMAEGIDGLAHRGALDVQGNTIAVLPCGHKNIYPKTHIDLYNEILENGGLVITEYSAELGGEYKKFVERNRIVASLSVGTLVIEGGHRSGTGITSRIAKDLGRAIFCIPSNLDSPKGEVPNRLLRDGAYFVTEGIDVIDKFENMNFEKSRTKQKLENKKISELKDAQNDMQQNIEHIEKEVSPELKEVYSILQFDKLTHIDEIIKKINAPVNEVNSKLVMLELEGAITSFPGGYYKKI